MRRAINFGRKGGAMARFWIGCLLLMLGSLKGFAAADGPASLKIFSEPEGATVYVNDAQRGSTPLHLEELEPGQYVVKLAKEGYDRAYKSVGVLPGQTGHVDLRLQRTTGLLLADSTPRGSEVFVQGELKGVSPALITDLPLGEYEVDYRAAGLPKRTVRVVLKDRRPMTAHVRHAPRVEVHSVPTGAEVLLDNQIVGTTPLTLSEVSEGAHVLLARIKEHDDQERDVLFSAGWNETINFKMKKNSGALILDTEPSLVNIYINGELYGTTQSQGMVDSMSQSMRIPLKAGLTHRIQLQREGYVPETLEIRPEIDQVITRHAVLKRIFIRDTLITTETGVIACRLEYELPNGDLYYERFPGIYNTAKASEVRSVEPLTINDSFNSEARRMMEQSKLQPSE